MARKGYQVFYLRKVEITLYSGYHTETVLLTSKLAQESASIEKLCVKSWPVVEQKLCSGRPRLGCTVRDYTQ